MSVIIKGIYSIDPQSVEFTSDGSDDGDIVYPEKAYEILAIVNDKPIDTYGVVWMIDDKPHAFIDEDFEILLRGELQGVLLDDHILEMNNLIFKKYDSQEIEFPFTVL